MPKSKNKLLKNLSWIWIFLAITRFGHCYVLVKLDPRNLELTVDKDNYLFRYNDCHKFPYNVDRFVCMDNYKHCYCRREGTKDEFYTLYKDEGDDLMIERPFQNYDYEEDDGDTYSKFRYLLLKISNTLDFTVGLFFDIRIFTEFLRSRQEFVAKKIFFYFAILGVILSFYCSSGTICIFCYCCESSHQQLIYEIRMNSSIRQLNEWFSVDKNDGSVNTDFRKKDQETQNQLLSENSSSATDPSCSNI